MKYQIILAAQRLKRVSTFRIGNPYAVVKKISNDDEIILGRTEEIEDTLNPRWSTPIDIETDDDDDSSTPLRVIIYDDSSTSSQKILLAEATFNLISVHAGEGHTLLLNDDRIRVTVLESIMGSDRGIMNIQFRLLDVKNIESGLLGLGKSDPFVEIEKYSTSEIKDNNDEDDDDDENNDTSNPNHWLLAYRTEQIMDNLNPVFDEFRIDTEKLCFCNMTWPIRLVIYDWQSNGKHRPIGYTIPLTIEEIRNECISLNGNADRSNAVRIIDTSSSIKKQLLKIKKRETTKKIKLRGDVVILKADYYSVIEKEEKQQSSWWTEVCAFCCCL